jgi:hypothetical protein
MSYVDKAHVRYKYMSSSVDAISIKNATILTSYAAGQSITAIKYSRAPIGNSIRIGRGNCIVKKVVDHYSVGAVSGL